MILMPKRILWKVISFLKPIRFRATRRRNRLSKPWLRDFTTSSESCIKLFPRISGRQTGTNPGYESLVAAFRPAATNYIFFVRTTGGRHTFSETLAAHTIAVKKYRAMTHVDQPTRH